MAEQSKGWSISKLSGNPNDQWLIKSANRVMGPFKLTEVVTGLELKHFTVLDEIAAPFGRWVLVRDEPALQAAVKDIRNRVDSVENTATLTHTLTSTSTKSMNTSEMGSEEATAKALNAATPKSKADNKQASREPASRNGILLPALVGVLVIVAALYFWGNRKKNKDSSTDNMAQVIQLKNQGFYERSFALLNKLKSESQESPSMDLNLGIYQIVLQGDLRPGRKNIEKVLSQLDGPDQLAEAHTAIAFSYMKENDFKSASEALSRALDVNPHFVPALINRAIISFKNGTPEEAEQDFEPVMAQVNNGVVILGSTLASLNVDRKGVMPKRILPVLLQMLDEYLKNNFEYQQEAYVLQAYIYNVLDKPEQRQNAIVQLLNSDLESGQGHRYDLLVDRSVLDWKKIKDYCEWAVELAPRDLNNRSFLAYCLSKSGDDFAAKKIILEAEAEAPRDPYVAAIKAFIMRSIGQDAEARASLGVALSNREIVNAWLLKSKYCETDHDDACLRETLGQVISVNPRSLPAYVGMAKLELRRGNKKLAADWIARGQVLSQTFLPLWEIKSAL